MENTNVNRMPMLGEAAPAFDAVTTQGTIHFPKDYKGNGSSYSLTQPTLHPYVPQNL